MAPFLADPLCAIFNSSFRQPQGHVSLPKIWKQANVIPVPKIHPPKLVENDLRPISLTATLSKNHEAFVGGWHLTLISTVLFNKDQLPCTSLGVAPLVYSTWQWRLSACIVCNFVDYSKAFDRVDHSTVVNKNSSGDEIANVNFLTTISHTRRPTSKYRKRENLLRLTN